MGFLFAIVRDLLMAISAATGLSYNAINILVYYGLIPLVFLVLVDRIIKKWICTPVFILAWTLVLLFVKDFSRLCDRAFDASVVFLQSFGFLGWDYIAASVIICVVSPAIVFSVLFYYAFPQLFRKKTEKAPSPHA